MGGPGRMRYASTTGSAAERKQEDAYHLIQIYYSPDYTAANDDFDTTRKATWVAESLRTSPIPNLALTAPTLMSQAQLEAVHDRRYDYAVKTGQPQQLVES